jgi:hypothetical protein
MSQHVDNTPNTKAIDTQLGIDPQAKLITVQQRNDRFAIKPDTVQLPFDVIKVLAAQVTLIEAGMMAVAPSGVVGEGQGNTADAGAARSSMH